MTKKQASKRTPEAARGPHSINGKPASEADLFAWFERSGKVGLAQSYWRWYFATRDPAWIVKACESLRHAGIDIPKDWLEHESWAKRVDYKPSPKRRPFKADRLVMLGQLIDASASLHVAYQFDFIRRIRALRTTCMASGDEL